MISVEYKLTSVNSVPHMDNHDGLYFFHNVFSCDYFTKILEIILKLLEIMVVGRLSQLSVEEIMRNVIETESGKTIKKHRDPHIDGILPKGPYPPCLGMADRALLAGYPWIRIFHFSVSTVPSTRTSADTVMTNLLSHTYVTHTWRAKIITIFTWIKFEITAHISMDSYHW